MAALAVKTGKRGRMAVPTPQQHPPGYRDRAPSLRIRPAVAQREYGKRDDVSPAGAGFGNTGLTSRS